MINLYPYSSTFGKSQIVNKYLWFGYLPPNKIPSWLDNCIKPENKGFSYAPEETAKRFDTLFDILLSQNTAKKHFIPLSGGWDSRAILGAMIERLPSNQIETLTFGVPGQLDYDIGLKIAKKVNIKSNPIDLRMIKFSWDAIIQSVNKSQWTNVPDGYFNQYSQEKHSNRGDIIWSGFLGGLTNNYNTSYSNIQDELIYFINREKRVKSIELMRGNIYQTLLSSYIPYKIDKLSLSTILHFAIHNAYCTANIVTPVKWTKWCSIMGNLANGASVIAPFADEKWGGYWLQAQPKTKYKQNLFLATMNLKYPKLFFLPGKVNYGTYTDKNIISKINRIFHGVKYHIQIMEPRLRIRTNIGLNYLDYDEMFRKRIDYKETLSIAIDYLKQNDIVPWINLGILWKEHMKRQKDHGDAFQVLIGLAANLKVNGIQNNMELQ